jgi:histidine triad (HIT) family protein
MPATIFSKIIAGEIPCRKAYEDNQILAFHDIKPQAPVHVLIIPKAPIPTIDDLQPADEALVGRMVLVAQKLARELGIAESGFRLVFNCREHGGQEVYHLHLHLLGGRPLSWPPG